MSRSHRQRMLQQQKAKSDRKWLVAEIDRLRRKIAATEEIVAVKQEKGEPALVEILFELPSLRNLLQEETARLNCIQQNGNSR